MTNDPQTDDDLAFVRTPPTKAQAFEWLREIALSEDAPPEAQVAIIAWHDACTKYNNLVQALKDLTKD